MNDFAACMCAQLWECRAESDVVAGCVNLHLRFPAFFVHLPVETKEEIKVKIL